MLGSKVPLRDGAPILLALRSSEAVIVTTASFAVFTDIFLYGVIVPVLPFSLPDRLDIAEDDVQYWVSVSLAVYAAALLAGSPLWGYLADRIQNRRIPMLLGLIALAGATVLLCLSRNIAMLLVGRVLQGLSGSLTWVVGLALVIDTVDSANVGRATGWISMATSAGVFVAPLLGGVVYEGGGYYSVFAMCFGLITVDIALRLIIIEVKEARRWLPPAVDETGVEIPGPARAPVNLGLKSILGLLRKPRLLAALWGTLVFAIIQTAFDSTLPLLVEELFHWGALGAGLIFLPLVLPSFLGPLIGMVGDRYGPKWLAACGFLFATPCLVCLRLVVDNNIDDKVLLCGLLAGVGIGTACVFGPLTAEITWSVAEDDSDAPGGMSTAPIGIVYALYNMSYSGGALIGPLMGGMIRDHAGWGTLTWVLALFAFVTSITQAIWIGGPLKLGKMGRGEKRQSGA